jgi:hypothetical protein
MEQTLNGDHFQVVAITMRNQKMFLIEFKHSFDAQHPGNIRTVQVHVQKPHSVASLSQTQGEIHGNAGLTHAPLATHHQKLVLDMLQMLSEPGFVHIRSMVGSFFPMTTLVAVTLTHAATPFRKMRHLVYSQFLCQEKGR